MTKTALAGLLFALASFSFFAASAKAQEADLDKVYADETHCLTGPEIRGEGDGPRSCYCRDAIVEARYVWQTYLTTGKDRNLNGIELTLQVQARESCGKDYNVYEAVQADDWKWNGPEVVRTSPPDDVLRQIKPDDHGMIHYSYTVVLLQRGTKGQVVNTENFIVEDMVPLSLLTKDSKASKPH